MECIEGHNLVQRSHNIVTLLILNILSSSCLNEVMAVHVQRYSWLKRTNRLHVYWVQYKCNLNIIQPWPAIEDVFGWTTVNISMQFCGEFSPCAKSYTGPWKKQLLVCDIWSCLKIFFKIIWQNESVCIRSRNWSAMFRDMHYFLTLLVAHVQFTSRMNEKLSRLFLLCSHLTLASCLV